MKSKIIVEDMKKIWIFGWACLAALNVLGQDFVKGADIGFLTMQEKSGQKFYDVQGNERECLSLLKDYQLNAVRLRVWVNPRWGGCDAQDVLQKALRAQAAGMDILIAFHYSDSWSDPAKQPVPEAWKGHSYRQMKRDLARHTIETLRLLKDHGVSPRWVQVGNETRNGMLWDMGRFDVNPEQYAGFIRAGYEAAKKVFPETIVMVHLDNGFDSAMFDDHLDTILRYGGKFDMIGMSLYPYWAMKGGREPSADQTITDGIANINHLWEKFGREVMIVETGFEVDEQHPEVMEQGRDLLARMIREARTLTAGHCRGVFYWEPQCLPGGYQLGAFSSKGAPTVIMDGFVE